MIIPLHTNPRGFPDGAWPVLSEAERFARAEHAMLMVALGRGNGFRVHGRKSPPGFMTLVEKRLHQAGQLKLGHASRQPSDRQNARRKLDDGMADVYRWTNGPRRGLSNWQLIRYNAAVRANGGQYVDPAPFKNMVHPKRSARHG